MSQKSLDMQARKRRGAGHAMISMHAASDLEEARAQHASLPHASLRSDPPTVGSGNEIN